MNLTLFLGAGFSAAFGHPVMNEFLGFADSCPRLTDDDRSFLGKLVLEARRANSFLESSPTNIEDILSFAEMGERLRLTPGGENRNHRLRDIVRKVYTTAPPSADYWSRYSVLKNLTVAEPRRFNGKLSFVTTNYDLNIESACHFFRAEMNPGFQINRVPEVQGQTVYHYYAPGGIPMYKLHGSVNWFEADEEPGLAVEDRIVAVEGSSPGSQQSLPLQCASNYKPPGVPVIVPPSFLKPDLPPALKAVWSGAAQALSKASVVAFVGYSFPPSDTDMMFFLASALAENAELRAVYLIDPNADEIAVRLRAPGTKMGSHFRELLRPKSSNWTKTTLPLKADDVTT